MAASGPAPGAPDFRDTALEGSPLTAEERRVVRNFLDREGRLPALPARRAKRQLVLRWLAQLFEPGRRYGELEVNALLAARHNDYASVRRYLVDEGLMERAAGQYWRAKPPSGGPGGAA